MNLEYTSQLTLTPTESRKELAVVMMNAAIEATQMPPMTVGMPWLARCTKDWAAGMSG